MNIAQADIFISSLGVEAYRVGGSVRDELIGKAPKDADYMVRGVSLTGLRNAIRAQDAAMGIKPLVLRDGQQVGWRIGKRGFESIEIVLPRKEVSTGPGHGDFKIIVDPDLSLAEDAKRRDFTFNALYKTIRDLDRTGMQFPGTLGADIVDPTGRGLYDLERRIICTTHPDSFRDDPLRILRALRFVARGFELGTTTRIQMEAHADAVTGLIHHYPEETKVAMRMDGGKTTQVKEAVTTTSGTVLDEMNKILMAPNAVEALRIARDTGVLAHVFPELAPMLGFDQGSRYHDLTTDEHTFTALEHAVKLDAPLRVRWALLFHDSGKPETAWVGPDGRKHYYARDITFNTEDGPKRSVKEDHEDVSARLWEQAAKRMNAPSDLRGDVHRLVKNHMLTPGKRGLAVKARRMRVQFGDELLRDLFLHRLCDMVGKVGGVDAKSMGRVGEMENAREAAALTGVPVTVRDLEINGQDVMAAGATGKDIGRVLRGVLDEVVVRADEQAMSRDWQLIAAGRLV